LRFWTFLDVLLHGEFKNTKTCVSKNHPKSKKKKKPTPWTFFSPLVRVALDAAKPRASAARHKYILSRVERLGTGEADWISIEGRQKQNLTNRHTSAPARKKKVRT
jgi:hypothetical protein